MFVCCNAIMTYSRWYISPLSGKVFTSLTSTNPFLALSRTSGTWPHLFLRSSVSQRRGRLPLCFRVTCNGRHMHRHRACIGEGIEGKSRRVFRPAIRRDAIKSIITSPSPTPREHLSGWLHTLISLEAKLLTTALAGIDICVSSLLL